jgi:hypothetical protein
MNGDQRLCLEPVCQGQVQMIAPAVRPGVYDKEPF